MAVSEMNYVDGMGSFMKFKELSDITISTGSGAETTVSGVGFQPDLIIMTDNVNEDFVECKVPTYNVMIESYAESASSIGGGRLSSSGYVKETNADGFVFKNKGSTINKLKKVYCYKIYQ